MSSQTSQASFVDQLLAGQLFIAARAHDSLSEEVNNFLPSSISDVFPLPTEHSHKYKSAAYKALMKSQNHAADEEEDFVTNETKGSIVLNVLRDSHMQRIVSSYLSMSDKLSLIFAVSDEEETDEQDLDGQDKSADEDDTRTANQGISLSEDLFHREAEDLDVQRSQYLAQLVQTREVEAALQSVKHKLDRTENILNNPLSADLLRLNYMASKLFLLRDITSKNYEDYFSARGHYSAWNSDHQAKYMVTTNQALDKARMAAENCRSQHEESLLICQQLMSDVMRDEDKSGSGRSRGKGRPDPSVTSAGVKSKPRRRASVVVSANEGVTLRANDDVSEFKEMRELGLTYLARYQGGGDGGGDGDDVISKSPFSFDVDTPGRTEGFDDDGDNDDSAGEVKIGESEGRKEGHFTQIPPPLSAPSPMEYVADNKDLEEYRRGVSQSLKDFEAELCEHLESMSRLTLESVKKKFMSLEFSVTDDLPLYLKDIKWKIDQKRMLAITGTNQIHATKESLAMEFENRIEKSYGLFLEQQVTKLKRVQSYFHVEGST